MGHQPAAASETDTPPFFASWRRLYAAVLTAQALLVLLFYIFMRIFR